MPLICLSNFWRALEISSIYCKINLILTENCVISSATGKTITDTKRYVP